MSARRGITARWAASAASLAVLALGGVWLADRTHRWERPVWRHPSFVRLRGDPTPREPVWVIAVNPRCRHCVAALARVRARWQTCGHAGGLASLIVDTPVRPGAAAMAALPTTEVWWDRRGIWRRRWGHRLYGELMEFDAAGRFVRSVPALAVADPRDPCDDAPATRRIVR